MGPITANPFIQSDEERTGRAAWLRASICLVVSTGAVEASMVWSQPWVSWSRLGPGSSGAGRGRAGGRDLDGNAARQGVDRCDRVIGGIEKRGQTLGILVVPGEREENLSYQLPVYHRRVQTESIAEHRAGRTATCLLSTARTIKTDRSGSNDRRLLAAWLRRARTGPRRTWPSPCRARIP